MNVGKINPVLIKQQSGHNNIKQSDVAAQNITELANVTPDFAVKTPATYKKISTKTLENGLEIHSYKLSNGHRVTIVPMSDSPTIVKNYVNVGSLNETNNIKGISHFLEHMAFNGTNGKDGHIKLETGDSFKKIDKMGGWANASTNYAITDYVNSTPQLSQNDAEKQIEVIAAMTEDLKLSFDMIEKEKNAVCSEINMILDNPQTIAMDQTVRTLYGIKNPADEMVGGSVNHIKNLTRKDVKDYYDKYYTPDNMNLVITGDVNPDEIIKVVAKNFNSKKKPSGQRFDEPTKMLEKTTRKDFVSDKAKSTEITLGFAGPKNSDVKEKILYQIASSYIQSADVGLLQALDEYNSILDVGVEKISTRADANEFVYINSSSSEENSEKVLAVLFNKIQNAPKLDENRLQIIKTAIKNARENNFEYSMIVNNEIGNAVLNNHLDYVTDYNSILDSITAEEVNAAVKKYFNLNKAAVTLVHPQKNQEISFKSKKREPINMDKVSQYKLSNNYNAAFYETNTNMLNYDLSLITKEPYTKNACAPKLLSLMMSMGAAGMSKVEWDKMQEKNNLSAVIFVNPKEVTMKTSCSKSDFGKMTDTMKKMLYQPNLTQENLDKAKEILRDEYSRIEDSSFNVYNNYEAQNSPYFFTDEEVRNSIETTTLDDIKDCYEYLFNNSRGNVSANLPFENKEETKENILRFTETLHTVKDEKREDLPLYLENNEVKVLTKENNNSQADIMQTFKYKNDGTIKEIVTSEIMNSILSGSSIGLFDILREKEHLAYSVHSSIRRIEDMGELSCNILTTTDNKDIQEFSYDNVQKSIDGFNRQINELKAGKFTEEDLENAKMHIKAELLDNEGTYSKVSVLQTGLNSKYSIDYVNKLFEEIDNVTKDDVTNFAKKVTSNPPIYSIVASKDTLEQNKDYLQSLKN